MYTHKHMYRKTTQVEMWHFKFQDQGDIQETELDTAALSATQILITSSSFKLEDQRFQWMFGGGNIRISGSQSQWATYSEDLIMQCWINAVLHCIHLVMDTELFVYIYLKLNNKTFLIELEQYVKDIILVGVTYFYPRSFSSHSTDID